MKFRLKLSLMMTIAVGITSLPALGQTLGVKANALSLSHAALGVGAEMELGYRWSAELYGAVSPWKRSDDKVRKYWAVQPELRYWLCQAMAGHFVGVHLNAAQYNVGGVELMPGMLKTVKDHRYEGWLAGAGVTYGYQWVVARHWNVELSASAGYEYLHYWKYASPGRCAPQSGERGHGYWGPTKLSASLIYIF